MINNRVLLAGLAGFIAFFIMGWVVYGMLLQDFMAANMGSATGVSKTEEEMNFLWIIISNLAAGYLLAVIFGMYGSINSAMAGIKAGALIGFLMAMSFDAIMYATTNIMNMNSMWVDVVAWTAICGVAGGVVGGVLGMKSKVATA